MNRLTTSTLACLAHAACGGFGGGGSSTPAERDVSGNYTVTYDDRLTLRLDVGGAIREVTQNGYGPIADFGTINGQPTTLDLTAFCAKPEVVCPSEAFWKSVAVTQPDLKSSQLDLQKLTVVDDTRHSLDAGQRAAAISGLVDHAQSDRYLLGLGLQGAASDNCIALGISLAGGRFSRAGERTETGTELRTMAGRPCSLDAGTPAADAGATDAGRLADGGIDCKEVSVTRLVVPTGAAVDGIKDGQIFIGWAGGCAFGPVLAGATLTMQTGYTGKRTGNFDPPPFTPAPVVLPDGGVDGGP